MDLIVKIPDEVYKTVQDGSYCGSLYEELKAARPYNPSGNAISREALKEAIIETFGIYFDGTYDNRKILKLIDNAPPVPQVTVFTESTDEKAVADLKTELQSVIEARPNEQIAWEQGYEAGLAQGKQDRPQGVWTTDEKGYFYCDKCGKYPHDQYSMTNFCPTCGADMRGDNK